MSGSILDQAGWPSTPEEMRELLDWEAHGLTRASESPDGSGTERDAWGFYGTIRIVRVDRAWERAVLARIGDAEKVA